MSIPIKSILKSDVFVLFTGTTIAQLIPFAFSPVLTRLFEPGQFGLVAFFNAILFPLIILSTLRTELTIPLPNNESTAKNNAITGILISAICALLVLGIVLLFGDSIANLFKLSAQSNASLIWLAPSILAGGIMQILTFWLIRKRTFKRVTYNKISQTITTTGTSSLIGVTNSGFGLVPGEVAGRGAAALFALFQSAKTGFTTTQYPGFIQGIKSLFSDYKQFVLYNSLPAFLDTASMNLPVLIAAAAFSESTLGYFSFARLVVGAPIALISLSLAQATLPKLAERKRNSEPIWAGLKRNMLLMFVIGTPIVILALFFASPLFEFVFGNGWGKAGEFTAILSIPYLAKFAISPLSSALNALEKMRAVSLWQLLNFTSLATLFFVEFKNPEQFLWTICAVELVLYGIYLAIIYQNVAIYERSIKPS